MVLRKLLFLISLIVSFVSISALPTYIGIELVNLTDEPGYSCAGYSGTGVGVSYDYGDQGRIRALSSYPSLGRPFFFNLTYVSNSSQLWSGESLSDIDYHRGDIIYLPSAIEFNPGVDYKLFLDIDMIKLYLHLYDVDAFIHNSDNLYWTDGQTDSEIENMARNTVASSCEMTTTSNWDTLDYGFFAGKSPFYAVSKGCMFDNISNNCINETGIFVETQRGPTTSYDFNANGRYSDLYLDSVGNFEFYFTY